MAEAFTWSRSRREFLGLGAAAAATWAAGPLVAWAGAATARTIRFPVDGWVRYRDDFGDPRSGGRTHRGNDLFGTKLQRLLAARDGVITYLRWEPAGISGNMCVLEDADGWEYWYIHVNNDSRGTDDGRSPRDLAFPPGIEAGSRVVAGQHIAYMGDSGNAEGTPPHLHFEIHRPDGSVVNPYASLRAAARLPRAVGRGVAYRPGGGFYVLTSEGRVHAFDGAPHHGHHELPNGLARAIAVMPGGDGYVVLDGWGALHRFGSAASRLGGLSEPYWPGWDIARDVAITPSGRGFAVLDGWGGVHHRGDAPAGPRVYWRNHDIARSVAVTASNRGVYVLDGWGGVHVSGDAVRGDTPYWQGRDVARAIVAATSGTGYAVLDGWGDVHARGDAPRPGRSGAGRRWRSLDLRGGGYLAIRSDALTQRL